jgi:hypothetical protein
MEIVLEVPDKDVARVLELVKGIKRVKIKSPKTVPNAAKKELLAGLAEAVEDVKRHLRGEFELQSWDDLYAEMKAEEEGTSATNISSGTQAQAAT